MVSMENVKYILQNLSKSADFIKIIVCGHDQNNIKMKFWSILRLTICKLSQYSSEYANCKNQTTQSHTMHVIYN